MIKKNWKVETSVASFDMWTDGTTGKVIEVPSLWGKWVLGKDLWEVRSLVEAVGGTVTEEKEL